MPLPRTSRAMMCLAVREYDSAKPDHTLLSNSFADDRESLLADFAIRNYVVWITQIEFVDFSLIDKLVNFDGPLAFDRHGFELFRVKFDVFALRDLIATP
jgi:hypothetical protein